MAINFPDSPSVNDTHTVGDRTWVWDGTVWSVVVGSIPTTITELTINNDLTVDTSTLHVDSTNDRVGIGTTTPQVEVEVSDESPVLRLTDTDTALSDNELSSAIEFYSNDTSAQGVAAYVHADGDGSTGNIQLRFGTGTPGGASDRMTINSLGNVGIGTTSPATPLHIDGGSEQLELSTSTNTSARASIVFDPDGTEWHLGARGSTGNPDNSFYLWDNANSAYRMVVSPTGNVGIGTTSPGAELDVSAASSPDIRLTSEKDGSWTDGESMGSLSFYSSDASGGGAGVRGRVATVAGDTFGYTSELALSVGGDSGLFEVVRIAHEGNVGIGTTSPQTALEVRNGIITSRSQAGGQNTVPTDRGIALVCADMNPTSQFTPGLLFGSTDGQFTTNSPKYNAGIFGRADETYSNDSDTGMSIQMRFAGTNAGTGHGVTGAYGYAFGPTVLHCMVDNVADLGLSVRRWDDVYATNGTIQTSDERDKTNVTDLTLGLAFVNSLRPVSYTWNDRSGYVGTREHMGFVAQEIATVLGDDAADLAVWTHTESTEEIDEEGNTVTTVDRQGLRYNELMAPMVKAIQELSARVAALEAP